MKKKNNYDPLRTYAELLLSSKIYSHLQEQTYKDMLKFYHNYNITELKTFEQKINELVEYYESLQRKDFMVTREELLIDLIDNYFKWFRIKRGTVGIDCKLPTAKQLSIMFIRLKELYNVLKPIKGECELYYTKILDYQKHRNERHSLIMRSRTGTKLNIKKKK